MSSRFRPLLLALSVLATSLLPAVTVPVLAMPSGAAEAGRLQSSLARIAKLANREVRPPALRLARGLPDEARRLGELREPASTTQAQVGIALSELRQMGATTILDPHYLPALVAAGRAFVAVSGQDPLTRTTINPDYLGLETELAASEARLGRSAEDAGEASGAVKRLTRALAGAKGRAHRLERQIQRLRASGASSRARR
jgi:hypothetical protein